MDVNKYKHPLDEVLGFQENELDIENEYGEANIAIRPDNAPTEVPASVPDIKDEDDIATEKKIDAVYDAAMTTFQNQTAYTEIIEPRYAARNAEVAAQYLGLALNAAVAKGKLKTDRKRANAAFVPYNNGNKTTNNLIVADRNELLKMMSVDGEITDVTKK